MEQYLVINEVNDDIEYVINIITNDKGTNFVMRRSNAQSWSPHVRGKHILTITDTGNKMIIDRKINKDVNYDEYAELNILMNFIRTKDSVKMKYKVIQDIGLSL